MFVATSTKLGLTLFTVYTESSILGVHRLLPNKLQGGLQHWDSSNTNMTIWVGLILPQINNEWNWRENLSKLQLRHRSRLQRTPRPETLRALCAVGVPLLGTNNLK